MNTNNTIQNFNSKGNQSFANSNENSIQVFNNPQFGAIRTAGSADNPIFCLADVCKVLGLSAKGVNQRLTDEVISNYPITDSLGRTQQALFVNEDGLYDVILDSRKPEARLFRKWVTSEVLPSIRKTGGYIATTQEDTPELIMARALQVAQATIERSKHQLHIAEGERDQYKKEVQQLAPLAEYTKEVLQSTSTFTATQMAKDFGMSAVTFNRKLKDLGIIFYQSGQWFLTAKYQNKGYTDMRVAKYIDRKTGEVKTSQSLVWTEKGRAFLHHIMNAA